MKLIKIQAADKVWLKIVILNFWGWVFIYADRTVLNPIMAQIQNLFHLNNVALGLVSSVFFSRIHYRRYLLPD